MDPPRYRPRGVPQCVPTSSVLYKGYDINRLCVYGILFETVRIFCVWTNWVRTRVVIRRAFGFTRSGSRSDGQRGSTQLNNALVGDSATDAIALDRRKCMGRRHDGELHCRAATWLRGCFLLSAVYVYVYEWMSVEPPPRLLWCWCGGVVFSRCRAVLVKALLRSPSSLCWSCASLVPLLLPPFHLSCACVCRRACFVLRIPPPLCSAHPPVALYPIRPQSQWRALFHAPSLLEVPVERVIPARAHGSSRPHPTGGCE